MQQNLNEKSRETITKYLGDMHALEDHGLKSIVRQIDDLKDKGHPHTVRIMREMKQVLEQHKISLENRLKALGGSPTHPVKDAAAAVAGVVAGLYNQVRTEEASKSLRDDYTFFSHVAMAYLMLHTTTLGLGDEESGRVAEQGYRDAARLAMMVNQHMPELVVHELQQDKLPVKDVSEECRRLVHEAWTQAQPGMGGQPATQPYIA